MSDVPPGDIPAAGPDEIDVASEARPTDTATSENVAPVDTVEEPADVPVEDVEDSAVDQVESTAEPTATEEPEVPAELAAAEPAAAEPEFQHDEPGDDGEEQSPVIEDLDAVDLAVADPEVADNQEASEQQPFELPVGVGSGILAEPTPLPTTEHVLRAALEAVLLVVDEPVGEVMLAEVLEQPKNDVRAALESLSAEYTEQARGMDLRRVAGGWRLYTREDYVQYVERFIMDGQQARLTQAALETLAVIAYKQPVSRSRVSAIRGVGVDGVMRTLLARGLVEQSGAESDSGAHLYRTTPLFLEKMGLNSLEELPDLAPLLPDMKDIGDMLDENMFEGETRVG